MSSHNNKECSYSNCPESDEVSCLIKDMNDMLTEDKMADLSPQLRRKLEQLNDATCCFGQNKKEFVTRFSSVFERLLIEMIQAHYNTKQREQDLIKLVKSKGCLISREFIDSVIELLVQLYKKAPSQFADTSYERKVLHLFLSNKLSNKESKNDKEVQKLVQTLYRCNCFDIIKMNDSPGRLKLKDALCGASDIRQLHDEELIKMALTSQPPIRLPPDRWTNLLYRLNHHDKESKIQSLLCKHHVCPTVQELELVMNKAQKRYDILKDIDELRNIEELVKVMLNQPENVKIDLVVEAFKRLLRLKHLFIIRQCRGR